MRMDHNATAITPDSGIQTGFVNKTMIIDGKPVRYVVYVPHEYTPDTEWPLILFLHGAGERGTDGLYQTDVGIGKAIRRHSDWFPAIVVMPQCPKDSIWTAEINRIEAPLAQAMKDYTIDTNRVYLTGLSMGGYASWIWGATQTDTFAAMIPICGGGNPDDLKKLSQKTASRDFGTLDQRVAQLAQIPIWTFHGTDDTSVPIARSQEMVALLKKAGGNIKYTEFKRVGHESWDYAYLDHDVIKWLFKQKKK